MKKENISKFLKNYLGDLEYHYSIGGIETVNRISNGTPYFIDNNDFLYYVSNLKKEIKEVEETKGVNFALIVSVIALLTSIVSYVGVLSIWKKILLKL